MIIFSKKLYYILFLIIFSIIFNQYYGYIGILPIDSFLIFNSGFDLMNGHFPFKDYWTIKEPFIDLIQALEILLNKEMVLGPSSDGGYWLIGFSEKLLKPRVVLNLLRGSLLTLLCT